MVARNRRRCNEHFRSRIEFRAVRKFRLNTKTTCQLVLLLYFRLQFLIFNYSSSLFFAVLLLLVRSVWRVAHGENTQTVRSLGERDFDCWHVRNNNRKPSWVSHSIAVYEPRHEVDRLCVVNTTTCYLMTSVFLLFFLSLFHFFLRFSSTALARSLVRRRLRRRSWCLPCARLSVLCM